MTMRLLVDAAEFWPAAARDIASAHDYVFAQALSFEGDAAGLGLAGALLASPARDKRVLVDSFSKVVVSDRCIAAPLNLFDRGLRHEVRETRLMWDRLQKSGVPVRFTNPAGPLLTRLPARNHKKLVVIDDRVAYVGGINFSDHNFAWRDLMLRIEAEDVARFLRDDFLRTWRGQGAAASARFEGLELHALDGRSNEARFEWVLELLDRAREDVYVECAYLTAPFMGRLRAASERGVAVTIVAPERNNWRLAQRFLAWQAAASAMEVRLYRGRMTHMKAMLVDGSHLVLGSANFDLWSYRFQEEYLGLVTAPAILADFRERVMTEGLAGSHLCPAGVGRIRGGLASLELRSLERVALLFNGA